MWEVDLLWWAPCRNVGDPWEDENEDEETKLKGGRKRIVAWIVKENESQIYRVQCPIHYSPDLISLCFISNQQLHGPWTRTAELFQQRRDP